MGYSHLHPLHPHLLPPIPFTTSILPRSSSPSPRSTSGRLRHSPCSTSAQNIRQGLRRPWIHRRLPLMCSATSGGTSSSPKAFTIRLISASTLLCRSQLSSGPVDVELERFKFAGGEENGVADGDENGVSVSGLRIAALTELRWSRSRVWCSSSKRVGAFDVRFSSSVSGSLASPGASAGDAS